MAISLSQSFNLYLQWTKRGIEERETLAKFQLIHLTDFSGSIILLPSLSKFMSDYCYLQYAWKIKAKLGIASLSPIPPTLLPPLITSLPPPSSWTHLLSPFSTSHFPPSYLYLALHHSSPPSLLNPPLIPSTYFPSSPSSLPRHHHLLVLAQQ